MTFSLRMALLPLLLCSSLLLSGGCSSKKKRNSEGSAMQSASSDLDFDINADSDSGKAGDLRTVYFDFNSSQLSSNTRENLEDNAKFLKKYPSVEVQVEGHCDERGGIQYNLALGEKRARAIRNYLVAMGIARNRISTISFGKERPVAFGHDEDAWGKNRRGNFVVTAK